LLTTPSRPGELHPGPLTDPDVNLSIHPARATPERAAAFRQDKEFLRLPVDSIPTWVTCPVRSAGITLLPRYCETVRPCPADQYFRPHGASACAFSLNPAGGFSSSVPEPGIESRHLCTGQHMASKQVSATLVPGAEGTPRFRCRLAICFDAFSVVPLRSSFYSSQDVICSRLLTMTFTTAAFGRSSSWLFEACSYQPASKGLPSSSAQHRAPLSAFLTQPLHRSQCSSRYRCTGWSLPLSPTAWASRSEFLTRLNTRPAQSPVNASTPPSRAAPRDSGSVWVANPLQYEFFIHYTSPV
jgi:hypothetical protein